MTGRPAVIDFLTAASGRPNAPATFAAIAGVAAPAIMFMMSNSCSFGIADVIEERAGIPASVVMWRSGLGIAVRATGPVVHERPPPGTYVFLSLRLRAFQPTTEVVPARESKEDRKPELAQLTQSNGRD